MDINSDFNDEVKIRNLLEIQINDHFIDKSDNLIFRCIGKGMNYAQAVKLKDQTIWYFNVNNKFEFDCDEIYFVDY